MVTIKVDSASLLRNIEVVARNQIPFAMAKGLTKTAQDVQAQIIKELPSRFTLRTKWYQKNTPWGFKVVMATKKNLIAKIFTRAPWILEHEEGTVRRPKGKRFAVPQPPVRRTKRQLIPKGQKPRALLGKKRAAFILPTKSGSGIFYRRTKRAPLQFFYALIKQARIKPKLGFERTARETAGRTFIKNFQQTFQEAIRTQR